MAWKVISNNHHGWVLWNGEAYHTNFGGKVVIGTLEGMEDLAAWLNQQRELSEQSETGRR